MSQKKFSLINSIFIFVSLFCSRCTSQENIVGKYVEKAYYKSFIELLESGEYEYLSASFDSYYKKDFYHHKGRWSWKDGTIILNSYDQPKNDSLVKCTESFEPSITGDSVVFSIHIISLDSGIEYSKVPIGVGISLHLSERGEIKFNHQVKLIKVKWEPNSRKYIYVEDLNGLLKPISILNTKSNHFEIFYIENTIRKLKDKECFINEVLKIDKGNLIFRNNLEFIREK